MELIAAPCLSQQQQRRIEHDCDCYARLLQGCCISKDVAKGRQVHALILRHEHLRSSRYLHNLIVKMYGALGCIREAEQVFEGIQRPNSYSWNILIAAFAANGHLARAAQLLTAERSVVSWTTLLSAYAQRGCIDDASAIFRQMPAAKRNIVAWNAMIAGYVRNGRHADAMNTFRQLDLDGACRADAHTYATVVDALAALRDCKQGKLMQERILACGLRVVDNVVLSSLVRMLGRCGCVEEARQVYSSSNSKSDIVLCTTMIGAFAGNGHLQEAEEVYAAMQRHDVVSRTEMLTAYAQNGRLEDAKRVFDSMPHRNEVSWSAMISAYAHNGKGCEAVTLFKLMDLEGLRADEATMVSLVHACASAASLTQAVAVHHLLLSEGFCLDHGNVVMATAVVGMYGRCGSPEQARKVFNAMTVRNEVAWNTMVTAYAESGHSQEALEALEGMMLEGMQPDLGTAWIVLLACRHAGLLDCAQFYFGEFFLELHGSCSAEEFCGGLVSVLAKAGWLAEAEELVRSHTPQLACNWMTLLNACKMHRDFERGERVGRALMQLHPDYSAPYVVLSGMYTSTERRK